MALHLGQPAFDAIQNLKASRDWELFRAGLQEVMEKQIHVALEVPPELRMDACGYARALRDLVVTIELSMTGQTASRNYKPPVRANSR